MDTYTPSAELTDALRDYEEALALVDTRRLAVYRSIQQETDGRGATNAQVAEHTPWSEEHIRKIRRKTEEELQAAAAAEPRGRGRGKPKAERSA